MSLKYLQTNKISHYPSNASDITPSSGITSDNFNSFNFSKNFFTDTDNKYTDAITITNGRLTTTLSSACADANCKNCSDVECYTCKNGYYLEEGICKNTTGSSLYFLSPGFLTADKTISDIDLAAVTVTTNYTLSFFIKFFSKTVSADKVDILRIGALKLRLNFSGSNVNLELYHTLNTGSVDCVIANAGDFLPRFGKWTHISLAFYYDSAKLTYYPANLNFQVNFIAIATEFSCYNKTGLIATSLVITIPKESVALYASILVWDKYYVGVWGYQGKASPPAATGSFLVNACITVTDKTTNCYRDYTPFLVTSNYCANPAFYPGATCLAVQDKCPYGYFVNSATTDYCSCENKENKTWIVRKSDKTQYCMSI